MLETKLVELELERGGLPSVSTRGRTSRVLSPTRKRSFVGRRCSVDPRERPGIIRASGCEVVEFEALAPVLL